MVHLNCWPTARALIAPSKSNARINDNQTSASDCLLSTRYRFYPKRSHSQIHIFIFLGGFFISDPGKILKVELKNILYSQDVSQVDIRSLRFLEFSQASTWPF